MKTLTYPKIKLLAILSENRKVHREGFESALKGYKTMLTNELQQRMEQLGRGQWRIEKQIRLPEPIDQTKDYDAAIRMLELCTEDSIELEEADFRSFVMDEWDWKGQFTATNSTYWDR